MKQNYLLDLEKKIPKYYSQKNKKICLDYAKRLLDNNLPVIFDIHHLASLVGYDGTYLYLCSAFKDKTYRHFCIPKKNGGKREITEPLPSLKEIQRWILDNILSNIPIHKAAKAFKKNVSIKKNAYFHTGKDVVVSLDIQNFFPSITADRIYNVFLRNGYSKEVSFILKELCSYNNTLPQGAPTSPALSNIIFTPIDNRFFNYAIKNGLAYTRYADDLTFSGKTIHEASLISFVSKVLKENHFMVNSEKTKVMRKSKRQLVTGIVVNNKNKMSITKKKIKKLRQEIYYVKKYGLDDHLSKIGMTKKHYLEHLIGEVSFWLYVSPKNPIAFEYLDFLKKEQIRLKQFSNLDT